MKGELILKRLLEESKINKHQSYNTQKEGNQSSGINIQNIKFFFFHNSELLIKNTISRQTIAPIKSPVNTTNFRHPFFLEKLGTIITAAIQPAARLIDKSEIISSQIFITGNLTKLNLLVKSNQSGFIKLTKKSLISILITPTSLTLYVNDKIPVDSKFRLICLIRPI
ncbi:MAG: hypothetical protein CEO21_287 [Microgenomates group bacterium Gr01-1014_80]|nr:MAG: hypothetical protein CEO21_287 [Microgenomates group bacterium Gr01-1014_80]